MTKIDCKIYQELKCLINCFFLSLGYEPRCVYVSKLLNTTNIDDVLYPFNESAQNKSRLQSFDNLQKMGAKLSLVNLEHSHIRKFIQF
jgi:hypothetical protein